MTLITITRYAHLNHEQKYDAARYCGPDAKWFIDRPAELLITAYQRREPLIGFGVLADAKDYAQRQLGAQPPWTRQPDGRYTSAS